MTCTGHTWKVPGLLVHGAHREPGERDGLDPVRIEPDGGGRSDFYLRQATARRREQVLIVRAAAADIQLFCRRTRTVERCCNGARRQFASVA